MKRALTGVFLAVLVVLGLTPTARAADNLVISGSVSTSFSGQGGYTVNVFNPVEGTVTASVSNAGVGTKSLSCKRLSPDGLGAWQCSLSGGRLAPGSISVSARAVPKGGGKALTASKSGTVSVRALTISGPGTVAQGSTFSVSGTSELTVSASVSGGGSSLGCSSAGTRYTCNLRAVATVAGDSTTNTVTVTESGPGGYSKSRSTTVTVTGPGTPATPRITTSGNLDEDNQPLRLQGTSESGVNIQVLVDPPANRNWGSATTCASNGTWSCALSQTLNAGKHTIVVRAVDTANASRVSGEAVLNLTVKTTKPSTPEPTVVPTPITLPPPVEEPPPTVSPQTPTSPLDDGEISGGLNNILELLVLGLAVLTLARPGALSRLRTPSSASFTGRNPDEVSEIEPVGWGDQSPTWAAFGTDATDYWSRTAPPVIAPHVPFLARLAIDGQGFRAMFGSLWWLLQIGGIALGVLAAVDTGFEAVPPALGIVAAIVALSCFDALAGFLASISFAVLAIDFDRHSLAVLVALGLLWTALPLIAALLRPLRRMSGHGWNYRWDRLGDAAIGALICGWIAQRLAASMDAFAGTATGLPADANAIGIIAGLAIVGRVLIGSLVTWGYSERIRATEVFDEIPETRTYAVVLGFVVRMALFFILGFALIGSCWQLWVGLLLFAVPDIIAAIRSRSALAPVLHSGLPAGLTQVLVMVVWCSLIVAFAISRGDGDPEKLRFAFIAAGVLPAIFGLVQVMEDEDMERPPTSWRMQLAGVGILIATAALALHGWNY